MNRKHTPDMHFEVSDSVVATRTRKYPVQSRREINDAANLIEFVLERDFNGRGRGIHSKLDSAKYPIPKDLDKQLRYLGAVRNKAMVEPAYRIEDVAAYVKACEGSVMRLLWIVRRQRRFARVSSLLRWLFPKPMR